MKPVRWVVDYLCKRIPGAGWKLDNKIQPHEAHLLRLDNSKAKALLEWKPRWGLEMALDKTIEWHDAWLANESMMDVSLKQIAEYDNAQ